MKSKAIQALRKLKNKEGLKNGPFCDFGVPGMESLKYVKTLIARTNICIHALEWTASAILANFYHEVFAIKLNMNL